MTNHLQKPTAPVALDYLTACNLIKELYTEGRELLYNIHIQKTVIEDLKFKIEKLQKTNKEMRLKRSREKKILYKQLQNTNTLPIK